MASYLLSDESSSDDGGATIDETNLKVNEDFAKKFEHNKKREELQKLEAKHGKTSNKRKRDDGDEESGSENDSDSSSDLEDEDDAGELATEALDAELSATLKAIKSRDPRIYDPSSTFYTTMNEELAEAVVESKEAKPMYLKDYHRKNLMKQANGDQDEIDAAEEQPMTYDQEQDRVKSDLIGQMNGENTSDDEEDGDFLVKKAKEEKPATKAVVDPENAERDPETFLSNFMAARAWVPTLESRFQAFESDDEEEERRAEEYEEAYNLRFEDPAKSNEKLRSHARDLVEKYTVRRKELNPRQKARQSEKERRAAEKEVRKAEKARLRKLRIEELDERVRRVKRAAGVKLEDLEKKDFRKFIIDDWDEAKWESQMAKRFGNAYYEQRDIESEAEEVVERKKKHRVEKPEFDDDIDIKDIIPDFEEDEKAEFSLTDDEMPDAENEGQSKKKLSHKKKMEEKRKEAKKERRVVEQLVDEQLQLELNDAIPKAATFRYRETSPTSFGLTARDILLADDVQLNQFAGLKKLGTFRDPERKRKDKKHLGKKARLRQWRQETFGNAEGVLGSEVVPSKDTGDDAGTADNEEGGVDIREGKRKKRHRSKKQKLTDVTLED